MSFWHKIIEYRWNRIEAAISQKTAQDVRQALRSPARNFDDLLALLSPAADGFLEEMALAAHQLTVQRFGRTIQMFAPIYISSECTNSCV
jgi:2-iminoacetate synthase